MRELRYSKCERDYFINSSPEIQMRSSMYNLIIEQLSIDCNTLEAEVERLREENEELRHDLACACE